MAETKETEEKQVVEQKQVSEDVVEATTGENPDSKRVKTDDSKPRKRRRRQYDDEKDEKKEEDEGEEEDEDEDEDGDDDDVEDPEVEGDGDASEEDDLLEIDQSNIISSGRRTRGKVIDFAKAAEKLDQEQGVLNEEDEDDEEVIDDEVTKEKETE